jgi:hypothetical protein
MAILTGADCSISRLGSGIESCQAIEGLPNGVILTPKGWSLNKATDTFNKAYVQSQIQLGNFIPLVGCFDAVSETPDATTQESQSGLMDVVRQGKPMFTYTFKRGLAFQRIAFSYNSFQQYDALITYETGYIKCVESADGTQVKGLSIGMFNTNGYSENTGAASASTVLKFQITDPFEYNRYAILLTNLDFTTSELNGITDCTVLGRADVSDAKVYAKVQWLHNEQFPITGLSSANFGLNINGVEDAISGAVTYNDLTDEYAITPTTALTTGSSVIVRLREGSIDTAKLGNKFYRGVSKVITPVA